ncbi:permease [Bacillus pseudomycoides]|uniref:Permease n=1 Tax=Bacillus pseudomycoides TaxID=64104 RepID=A0AA91ZTK2_9BACI|nr:MULTISPECIES: permease [Bacillus]PEB48023.1 permease [Bacillus sp. AFS098217]PED82901.1 permease [Bacillus pseudomycoides]PEU09738.1 permease [Bacillus sp. AFS019443]PEU18433.1 permease [Bacillus sp. AFS014408]PFW62677.1 permease [Bacillus sp. AFS075034]
MPRKRTHHLKSGQKNEEYAVEISPQHLPIRQRRKEIAHEIEGTNTGTLIGYVALFLSLFSIAFYPVTLGSLSILIGLLAINFGARTLGYTAIGFGSFSILFTLLYPLALSAL